MQSVAPHARPRKGTGRSKTVFLPLALPFAVLAGVAVFGALTPYHRDAGPPPGQAGRLVWGDGIFANRVELRAWFRLHGGSYRAWARRHPAALRLVKPRAHPPLVKTRAPAPHPVKPQPTVQRTAQPVPRTTAKTRGSPVRTSTRPTATRPTVVRGDRIASRPASGSGGFPTVLVLTGVIGALLASILLLAAQAMPTRAGRYRRSPRPIDTKPPSRTGRIARRSPPRSNASRGSKASRAKHPPTEQPTKVKHLSRAKPPTTLPDTPVRQLSPVSLRESSSVEQPSRTKSVSPPPQPVDENSAAPALPDERATTDDLSVAPWPTIKPAEDPEQPLWPEVGLRPVNPVEADQRPSAAVREAPRERREVPADQFCEIRFWRGYVKCQLLVEVEGAAGALFESSLFRLRDPMVPDDRAQRVLADLLANLERSGWVVVETGPLWYRRRLQRSTPTP